MTIRSTYVWAAALAAAIVAALAAAGGQAQSPLPTLVDSNLAVREVTPHLANPIGMAFLGAGRHARAGEGHRARCSASSDGAVSRHRARPGGQLRLGARAARDRPAPAVPGQPGVVYLYWTESTTGADTDDARRRCRCSATASTASSGTARRSTLDRNLIRLRAFQAGRRPAARAATTTAACIRFGPDGKLYIFIGDDGRRGQLQNLPSTARFAARAIARRPVRRARAGRRPPHRRRSCG